MTDPGHRASTPPPDCPAHHDSPVALHTPEFAADPHAVYTGLREQGPIAPVELAPGIRASLVVDHRTALTVLRDPETFRKDSSTWQRSVPADSPVVAMMMYRENVLFHDGAEHDRLREAITDSLGRVETVTLRSYVSDSAETLIGRFGPNGHADLLTQYARLLPVLVLNKMFGSPPELTDRMVTAITALWDGLDAQQANQDLTECVVELIALKRRSPAADMTSWLLQHPAELTDEEALHQLVVLMGAGSEPLQNLVANALRLWLSDDRFAGDLSGGRLPVEDAIDEVLWKEPPLANYAITYPVHDVDVAGHRLPAHEPVVISLAAANTDPALATHRESNRAHLAWSAGTHTCPARGPARLIASIAVETILDSLPDMDLAVPADELEWRSGPFHRALQALPVRFPPVSAPVRDDQTSGDSSAWSPPPAPTSWTPPETTSTPKPPASAGTAPRRGWRSPATWWRGR